MPAQSHLRLIDIAEGGTGSATMAIDIIIGTTLTLTLDNTSPTELNDLSGPNSPGIVTFGFNLENDTLPILNNWTLAAETNLRATISLDPTGENEWALLIGGEFDSVQLDYIENLTAKIR